MVNEMIESWFESQGQLTLTPQNRQILLSDLIRNLKVNGVKSEDIGRDEAVTILDKLTPPELPELAAKQLQTMMIMEIDLWRKTILDSESGFVEEEYVPQVIQPVAPRAPRSDDIIEMDESESIKIDRNELKDKEYDLELLERLGINVEDLANE